MDHKKSGPTSQSLISYRIGDITLDPARRTVRRDNTDIRLGKLTYELLLLLVESAPRVVTQEEVAEKLWNDRHVTQDTVRQRVKLLRKALADNAEQPRYFSVVRGQGYRLIPEVVTIRGEPSPSTWSRQRLMIASISVVVVATLALFYWVTPGTQSTPDFPVQLSPDDKSIAVLPFENLTGDVDDAYFVDGFHNDLLTQLAKISSFKVISRTSVVEYRDRKKNMRQIGDELNVSTVLEGSVQRSGKMVRINAQLIDATNDKHLWAERYDRELTAQNLFVIQTEMSLSIADALQAMLSPEEIARLNEIPTENTRAYNHYLIGNHNLRDVNNMVVHELAAQAFQRAVEEDPEFALAWAALSRAHSAIYFFVEQSKSREELTRKAVERAFELQPDLPEAHLAMGYYYYHCLRDYESAQEEFSIAERGMPGDPQIYVARAHVYGRMGDWERSMANLERVVSLDPRNINILITHAFNHVRLQKYADAELLFNRIREIAPNRPVSYRRRADIPLWRDGDVTAMRAVLDSAPIKVPAPAITWLADIYERNYEAALAALDKWPIDAVDSQRVYRPKSWFYGMTYELADMPELSAEFFIQARAEIELEMKSNPADLRFRITYADILAHLGEHDVAIELANRVMDSFPMSMDAAAAPNMHLFAIKALLAAGDYEAAIEGLDKYLAVPAVWTIEGLLPDPRFDPIRYDPRFTALVHKYARKVETDRIKQTRH